MKTYVVPLIGSVLSALVAAVVAKRFGKDQLWSLVWLLLLSALATALLWLGQLGAAVCSCLLFVFAARVTGWWRPRTRTVRSWVREHLRPPVKTRRQDDLRGSTTRPHRPAGG